MRMPLSLVPVLLAIPAMLIAAPPLELYGRLPAVESLSLSPSGKRFASVTVLGEKRQLVVVALGGRLLQTVDVGDFKLRDVWWAGEDHVLAFTSSTFKAPLFLAPGQVELWNAFSLSVTGGHLAAVFEKNRTVSNAVLGSYGTAVVGGRSHAYFGGVTEAGAGRNESVAGISRVLFADLYQVDLDTGRGKRMARGSPQHRGWVVDEAGTVMAHAEYHREDGNWRLYAGEGHEQRLMEIPASFELPWLAGRGRTPGTVLVREAGSAGDVVVEIDVRNGARQELLKGGSSGRELRDPASGLLLGLDTGDPAYPVVFVPALQARLVGTAKAFPGQRARIDSFSSDYERLLAFTDGGTDSGTWWLVDIRAGTADPIGRAYPKIPAAEVGASRLFGYKAGDGLALDGVLTLPPGRDAEKLPVVVLPHGGPIGISDEPGFDWWAQAYASLGYAVFQPNFRGSGGRGSALREAGFGEWGDGMLGDIADGLAALATAGIVDPRRACIVGASYGGYAALAGVTLQQGLYRCAVAVAPVADLPAFMGWMQRGRGSKHEDIRFLREAIGDADMARISPRRLAAQADAPVLLLHGADDTVVPVAQSESMADALKKADRPHAFMRMQGEDHWLSREATRITMLEASAGFLKRYNPPD